MPLKRDNHFVPQAYLRRWSEDDVNIFAHLLLVSHEKVRLWERRAIKGLAYRSDLYTMIQAGSESDEVETWLEEEFETPAEEPLRKLTRDAPLTRKDWTRLAYYAAAQSLRTPAAYLKHQQRQIETMPALMEKVLARSVARLERAAREGKSLPASEARVAPLVPLRVHTEPDPDGERMQLRVEVSIGRTSWLRSMRHLLSNTAKVLARHSWSVMYPDPGTEWFTSDHPLIQLNYYAPGEYDFKGGWGNRGGEILFPLSPRHLMYTQMGKRHPRRIQLTGEKTLEMQKLIAEHAHRWIFAREPMSRVSWFRSRLVNAHAFQAERNAWERWHQEHAAAEQAH